MRLVSVPGRPVVLRNRIYVPDYTNRQVVIVELGPLRQLGVVQVAGKETFDVFSRDGRVWINDQYHRQGTAIDGDRRGGFDKGPGAEMDGEPAATSSPWPSVSPQRKVLVESPARYALAGAEADL